MNKKNILPFILLIVSVVLLILSVYNMNESNRKDDIINSLEKEISSYKETIEKVEEEVGIIEDLKYQIEGYDITLVRKMNELEESEQQIAEKKAELESIN